MTTQSTPHISFLLFHVFHLFFCEKRIDILLLSFAGRTKEENGKNSKSCHGEHVKKHVIPSTVEGRRALTGKLRHGSTVLTMTSLDGILFSRPTGNSCSSLCTPEPGANFGVFFLWNGAGRSRGTRGRLAYSGTWRSTRSAGRCWWKCQKRAPETSPRQSPFPHL